MDQFCGLTPISDIEILEKQIEKIDTRVVQITLYIEEAKRVVNLIKKDEKIRKKSRETAAKNRGSKSRGTTNVEPIKILKIDGIKLGNKPSEEKKTP